jgi:hypothetical protein
MRPDQYPGCLPWCATAITRSSESLALYTTRNGKPFTRCRRVPLRMPLDDGTPLSGRVAAFFTAA